MGEGFSETDNDCDDTNALIYPGTSTICYTGPQGTDDVGACKSGLETCLVSGLFGSCVGEVLPSNICVEGVDSDCNGSIDICPSGSSQQVNSNMV